MIQLRQLILKWLDAPIYEDIREFTVYIQDTNGALEPLKEEYMAVDYKMSRIVIGIYARHSHGDEAS